MDAERLRIELTFKKLADEEAKYFTEWLDWEGPDTDPKPFLRVSYDVTRKDERINNSDIKAGADADGHILTAEAKDKLKATYLKPLRDAKSELSPKRNSRLSQILLSHKAFNDKKGHRLVQLAGDLNKEVAAYFLGKNAASGADLPMDEQLGKEVKTVIDTYLNQFSKKNTEFRMTASDLKSILEALCVLFQDGYNLGLGSHNLLSIASELLHLKKDNWDGLRLGLIEEIEAHLHPQVQLQVVETLKVQATGVQLIFTTHSPNIGSKVPLENLIICKDGKAFPMGRAYTELEAGDYKFLEIFLDVTKANLFFAKGIIMVEGWAEEILVPAIARHIGIDLTEYGVSIINVGSLAYLRYANVFLRKDGQKMDIPVAVVTDMDVRTYEKILKVDAGGLPVKHDGKECYDFVKRDQAKIDAEVLVKKAGIGSGKDNIQYFVAPEWTFEYCLHSSTSLTKLFAAVAKKVHSKTDWETDFEKALAEKLINKGLKKTEIAYQMAQLLNIDVDEEKKVAGSGKIHIKASDAGDKIQYLIKAILYATGN